MEGVITSIDNLCFLRFKNGDEYAFELIFKSRYNKLLGFCNHYVIKQEEAKHIVQDAFLNLWINRKKIDKVTGINSFLYTYIKSKSLNYIKHQQVVNRYKDKIASDFDKELSIASLESMDFSSLEIIELNELIKQSIENLPEKCRLVFVKKRFEEKTNIEVAEEIGISIKSVEAHMTRAIKILKISLSEYLPLAFLQFIFQS